MQTNANKIMISLPEITNLELIALSKELKIPKSKLIQQALDYYFDVLDLQIAKERLSQNNKKLSLDEMKAFVDEL